MARPTADPAEILRALAVLCEGDQVVELRAIGADRRDGTESGYYDAAHWPDLARDAAKLAARGASVYITANRIDPALLARSANRIKRLGKRDATTTDANVIARRWFLVDVDPLRPSGISASDTEKRAAAQVMVAVRDQLTALGWPAPVAADSGNGWHALWRIDEPADDATRDLVQHALEALAAAHDTEAAKVDRSVFNAARIWKLYGTPSAKGDHTEARPHRLAHLRTVPETLGVVTRAQLEALAALRPAEKAPASPALPAALPAARAAPRVDDDPFATVNRLALERLSAWVPALFTGARTYRDGYRVSSRDLGRDLEEDLQLSPQGIYDFGTERGYSAVDCALQFGGRATPLEAAQWLAEQIGYRWPERGKRKAKPATRSNPVETPEVAPSADAPMPPPPPEARASESSRDTRWRERLYETKHGYKDCRENVAILLEHHPLLRGRVGYDDFARRVMRTGSLPWAAKPGEWSARDDRELGAWIAANVERGGLPLLVGSETTIVAGVSLAAERNTFHPVQDFLAKCAAEWDRVERVEHWLEDFLGVERSEYSRLVGRYWLLNMVARAMEPGCVMRQVPVLEGRQDRGKSSALRMLGSPWFSDSALDLDNPKEAYQSIAGVWLQEIAEMSSFSKVDAGRIKEFISAPADRYRPSYERRSIHVPRQCVFAGTSNEQMYLRDWSGNTRFWPLRTGRIDLEGLGAMREQLFGEAVVLYRTGGEVARRHPTDEQAFGVFRDEQAARELVHPWEEAIAHWLDEPWNHASPFAPETYVAGEAKQRVTARQVIAGALHIETGRILDSHAVTVGRIMSRLGWSRKRIERTQAKAGQPRGWCYERPKPRQAIDPARPAQDRPTDEEGEPCPF